MLRHGRTIAASIGAAALAGAIAWGVAAETTVPLSGVLHIHGMAVDAADRSRLLLATHHGVWRTGPDGTATLVSETQDDFMGFTAHPADEGVFFASGHPAGGGNLGFVRSDDGARTWSRIAMGGDEPADFHAMDVSPADPAIVYGLYGELRVSRDGGESWRAVGAPPADVIALAASAEDASTVFAATRSGLLVSRDAGASWEAAHPARQPASAVEVAPDGTGYAFVVGQGVLRRAGPGLPWEPAGEGFGDRVLLHLTADPADPSRVFAVTDEGVVVASPDGGESWAAFGG